MPVELIQKCRVVAPVFLNFDEELQKDLRSEHLFDILSCFRSDLLQHRTSRADDDALLSRALDVDRRDYFGEALLFFPEIDEDGDRVRHFLTGLAQDLLTYQLRRQEALRLIRNLVLWKIWRTLRDVLADATSKFLKALAI